MPSVKSYLFPGRRYLFSGHPIFTVIECRVNPHLAAWRSDDEGVGIGKMLIRFWRETEASMRVARDEFGGIADPTAPLAGDEQRKQTRRTQVRIEVRKDGLCVEMAFWDQE